MATKGGGAGILKNPSWKLQKTNRTLCHFPERFLLHDLHHIVERGNSEVVSAIFFPNKQVVRIQLGCYSQSDVKKKSEMLLFLKLGNLSRLNIIPF